MWGLKLKSAQNLTKKRIFWRVLKYTSQAIEVHIIFDVPGIWGFNLKKKVQDERDHKKKPVPSLTEETITDSSLIPCTTSQWAGFLANRDNKRKLIHYIGRQILALKESLEDGQKIVVAGCNSENATFMVEKNKVSEVMELRANHEEADTRLFAHAKWSSKNVLHIVAADTDILSIALLNFNHFSTKTILLDQSDHSRVIHVNELVRAMESDQDTDLLVLKQKGEISIANFFGLIHPLTGSDILCSPRNFGPALILKACIDFSSYLFSSERGIQCLKDGNPGSFEAYACFILALFKKRFANKIKFKPDELFGTGADLEKTLEVVRQDVWVYTLENNTVLPSKECLEMRGKNLAFQLKIWCQATSASIEVPDPLTHGWEVTEQGYKLTPDSKENMEKRENMFKTIMKKCKCKKNECKNGRCACFNGKMNCSSFCECVNCCNPYSKEQKKPSEESDSEGSLSEADSEDGDEPGESHELDL